MSHEFDTIGATVKITGEAPLPEGYEFEHGDELYVVAKVNVKAVNFPETKEGNIIRTHVAKTTEVFVVDAEDAEKVIAAERERVTGQGDLIAELNRTTASTEDDDDFDL